MNNMMDSNAGTGEEMEFSSPAKAEAALLLVIGEPLEEEHKSLILAEVTKGFQCWNTELTGIDINDELAQIANRADLGEEGPEVSPYGAPLKDGERVIRNRSERLATEVLVNPQTQTLKAALKNFLHTVTTYKHLIYAGHAFQGSGAWILQDDNFTFNNFVHLFKESGTEEVLRQQEGSTLTVYTHAEGEWTNGHIAKNDFSKIFKVDLNPPKSLESSHGVLQFTAYVGNFVKTRQLSDLLPSSDVVGNIRFSRPTLYIFPGCQGDSALFGISGFNLLVNGGYSKKACFWDFTRHLDRIDAALMTHLGTDNLFGINSVLKRKSIENVHPEIGFLYLNASDKMKHSTTENATPDSKEPQLLVNLAEEGNKLIEYAKQIGQPPHPCSRTTSSQQLEPMNLYRKVGHGSLDMYILNPVTDSKELKEFYQQWNQQTKQFGTHLHMPIPNTQSICTLLVWRSADPNENITRILFPGNAPQHKVIEGLERLKNLDILKHAKCNNKDLHAKPVAKKTSAPAARPPSGRPKAPPVTTKAEPASTPRKVEHTPRIETKTKPKLAAAPKAKKEDLNKKTSAKGNEKADKTKSSSSSSPSKASTKSLTPTETPKDAISPVSEPAPQEPEGSEPLAQVDETGSEPQETELSQQPDETSEPDLLEPIPAAPVDLVDLLEDSPSHLPEPEESEHMTDETPQSFPNRGALDKDAMRELGIYDEDEDMADLQQYGQNDGMNAEEEEEEVHPEPLPEPVAYSPSSYTQEPDIIPSMQVCKEEPTIVKEITTPVSCQSTQEPDVLPLEPKVTDMSKPEEELDDKLQQEVFPEVQEVPSITEKEMIESCMFEEIPPVNVPVTMKDSPKQEDAKDIKEEEEDVIKGDSFDETCMEEHESEVETKWENVEEVSKDMEDKLTPEDAGLSESHPQEAVDDVATEDDYEMLSPKASDSGVASDFQEYKYEEESTDQARVDSEDQQRESGEEEQDIYSKEEFEKAVDDTDRNKEKQPYLPEEALNPVEYPFEKQEQEYVEQTRYEEEEEAQQTPDASSGEVTPDEDLPRPKATFDPMQSSFIAEKHDFEEQDFGVEDEDQKSPLSQDEILQQPTEEIPQEEGPTKAEELEENIVLSPETQEEFSDKVSEEDCSKHAEDESGSCEQSHSCEASPEEQSEQVIEGYDQGRYEFEQNGQDRYISHSYERSPEDQSVHAMEEYDEDRSEDDHSEHVVEKYDQGRLECEHGGQDRSISHSHETTPEDQSEHVTEEYDQGRFEDEHEGQDGSISHSHEATPEDQSEQVTEECDQGRFEDEYEGQDGSISHSHEATPEDQSEQVTEECDQGRFEYEHDGQDGSLLSIESPQEDNTDSDMRRLIQEPAEDEPSIEQSDSFMPPETFDKGNVHPNSYHLLGTDSQQTDYLTPESEATDPSHGMPFGYQQMEDQEGDNDENDSIEDVSQEDEKDVDESYPARGMMQEQDLWQQGSCAGGSFAPYTGGMASHQFGLIEQTGYNPFLGLDQQSQMEAQPGAYFSPSEQQSEQKEFDPLAEWGQPMGLPSPPPPEEAQAIEQSPAKEAKDTKNAKDTKSPRTKTKPDTKKPDPKRLSTAPAQKARSASASNKQATKSANDTKSANGVPETKSKARLSLGGNTMNSSRLDAATDKKNPAPASPKARPTSAPVNGKQANVKPAESKSKANGTKRPSTATGNRSSPATVPMPSLPPFNAFYLDLAYIPNHGNSRYVDTEFFKRVRARYYVLSTLTPNAQTLNALLEAKKTWEDKHAEVTLIPTHDNDTLHHWMGLNKEQLADLNIDVAPSASRCTIQLQDHETSCSAYRLEF